MRQLVNTSIVPLVAILPLTGSLQAHAGSPAQSVFASYQSLERAFSPDVADLYCDTAVIRNVRTYPDGQQRTLEMPASKYKALIRAAMPLAKAKGDYSTYSKVAYAPEGENVRITATRYSVVKQYSSPISLLVGSCNGGDWALLEELSQSQP
jgi:hypothetical protein